MTLLFNYHLHWHLGNNQSVKSSVAVVSRWLWPGKRTFLKVFSMVIAWWIVAFCTVLRKVITPVDIFLSERMKGWREEMSCTEIEGSTMEFRELKGHHSLLTNKLLLSKDSEKKLFSSTGWCSMQGSIVDLYLIKMLDKCLNLATSVSGRQLLTYNILSKSSLFCVHVTLIPYKWSVGMRQH